MSEAEDDKNFPLLIQLKRQATRECFNSDGSLKEEITKIHYTGIGEFYKRIRDVYEPHIRPPIDIKKLEADSLDAICETVGATKEYNDGKEAMRQWFLAQLRLLP